MTWVVALLSFAGVVLNIHKRRVAFLLWMGTNAFWAITDFQHGLPGQAALFVLYFITSVWGWVKWGNHEQNKN